MSRTSIFAHPLLLGFDDLERLAERLGKNGADGYPPYNIERLIENGGPERLRITLAVAGFTRGQLDLAVTDNQLSIRGSQRDEKTRDYLFRGIAARQFQRTFVLADGIKVESADLEHGLLTIDLVRIEPKQHVRRIEIGAGKGKA